MLTSFVATATTSEISPGDENTEGGRLRVRNRVFTDIVKSSDARVAGVNKPALDIDLNPVDGTGVLQGGFTLRPGSGSGAWEGRMQGQFRNGMVVATGLARGTGALAGAVMRVDFRQVNELPGPPACANPLAFFEMEGFILERE
jgi:hypothetical protein